METLWYYINQTEKITTPFLHVGLQQQQSSGRQFLDLFVLDDEEEDNRIS